MQYKVEKYLNVRIKHIQHIKLIIKISTKKYMLTSLKGDTTSIFFAKKIPS